MATKRKTAAVPVKIAAAAAKGRGGRICANVYMHPPWPKGRIGTTVITTEVPAECAIDNVGEAFFTLVCKTAPPEGARVDFIAVGPEA